MTSKPASSDEQLIRLLLNGREDAFTAIYRNCSGPVFRFALHMTGDSHIAEEITQDTFLHLLSHAASYQAGRGSLLAWLLGIARNHSRRALGSLYETEPLDCAGEYEQALDHDLLGDFARQELIDSVRQAIASLPVTLREVVILCELQELGYRETAAVLNCPLGTVRSRLHRARGLLTAKLQARCLA